MSNNRYWAVWVLQNRHRRAADGWGRFVQMIFGLLASLALVLLVRRSFLGFLDRPEDAWGDGIEAAMIRVCVLVVGWVSLDVYGAIVRSPYRAKLDLLPVQADQVVQFEMARVAISRVWLVPFFALLLSPVAFEGQVGLWGACVAVVFGAWLLGLTTSALVHLLAVEVAENPRYASMLDLIRGHNPRPQAAFIYAPGAVLLGIGGLLIVVTRSLGNWYVGQANLLLPLGALYLPAFMALYPLAKLARDNWFRASVVISEIDARYATLSDHDAGLDVYMEWATRYLPERLKVYAVHDLRHGWRSRRTWISATWVVAFIGFAAGWSSHDLAPERAMVIAIGGVWLCATVALLLERDEPKFLRAWLPPGGSAKLGARVVVLAAWLQPCVWGATLSTWARAGLGPAMWVFGVCGFAAAMAIVVAIGCSRLEKGSVAVYGPVAALLAACFVVVFTGGAS